MDTLNQTSVTLTIFINVFTSLIIKKVLDTALASYNNKTLVTVNLLLLISLIIVLIHSFSIFLKVSTQDTYREVLNQGSSRHKIRILFIAIICVYIILYLMADWFSGSISRFLFASLLLGLGWFMIDFYSSSVIYTYYNSQDNSEAAEEDPLFIATRNWWPIDIIVCILSGLIMIAVQTKVIKDVEAAGSILVIFFAAAIVVEHGLPNQDDIEPDQNEGSPPLL